MPSSSFQLIGLPLDEKTTNENGRSAVDIGNLWHRFLSEQTIEKIPNKTGSEVYAVYHDYEGDHTQPFRYFIGCRVSPGTEAPAGLKSLVVPESEYQVFIAKGPMPACIMEVWQTIWNAPVSRAFQVDYEVYDERSQDPANAEVPVYISVQ